MPPRKAARAAKAAMSSSVRNTRAAAAPPAVAKDAVKKRGRPAKAQVDEQPVEEPKKRGRKAAETSKASAAEEQLARRKRGAAATKAAPVDETVTTPKKRGRPAKALTNGVAAQDTYGPPKRRGRPSKSVVDLNRTLGATRISKRLSPRNKRNVKKAVAPAPTAATPTKARGRPRRPVGHPPKAAAGGAPTKAASKTKNARAVKSAVTPEKTKVTKPAAKPRKKRGITVIDVPDKYAKVVQEYVNALVTADILPELCMPTKADTNVGAEVALEDSEGTDDDTPTGDEDDEDLEETQETEEELIIIFEEERIEDAVNDEVDNDVDEAIELESGEPEVESPEEEPQHKTIVHELEIEEVDDVNSTDLRFQQEIVEISQPLDKLQPSSTVNDLGDSSDESSVADLRAVDVVIAEGNPIASYM